MTISRPHFLLLSETQRDCQGSARGGHWRFHLESSDGTASFGAADAEPETRGERLELLAVVRGLEALDQPSRVTLLTGSRYVSRGIRFGLPNWRETGWRWEHFGQMSPVANADLWQRIDCALRIHEVRCRPTRAEVSATSKPHRARARQRAFSWAAWQAQGALILKWVRDWLRSTKGFPRHPEAALFAQ